MKVKSEKRLLAEQLRLEQGFSYSEISERLGISKSTLSNWLKEIRLAPDQEERVQHRMKNNQSAFVANARQINRERFRQARENAFQTGVDIGSNIPDDNVIHELALAMLYLGEGDKTGNRSKLPALIQIFYSIVCGQ